MSTRLQEIQDQLYAKAVEAVREAGYGSVAMVQRKTRITYAGALVFLERMEQEGIVTAPDSNGKRHLIP